MFMVYKPTSLTLLSIYPCKHECLYTISRSTSSIQAYCSARRRRSWTPRCFMGHNKNTRNIFCGFMDYHSRTVWWLFQQETWYCYRKSPPSQPRYWNTTLSVRGVQEKQRRSVWRSFASGYWAFGSNPGRHTDFRSLYCGTTWTRYRVFRISQWHKQLGWGGYTTFLWLYISNPIIQHRWPT